jgi:type I restriction-modification system DNA methylase subunit
MALFQKSVLNKYLKGLDESFINQQYEVFKKYFLHPEIQDNIRSSKEEQFQATFLNELFVKVFGYTLNPNQNYNLTTEFKNVKNAKKADGAILQNGKAVGVIELKGMNTTSLDKVEGQAFGYKNNQPDAVYVITSNFEKLRFYIDDAVSFEEFNLFHLSLERFKILYLCLAKDNIFIGLPKQMKDTSLAEEENITKKLYKDYSTFKNDLFNSIVKLNPQFDKLLLFKKTQKLLDRFLFIFFSEDGGLLPPNSIKAIVDQWVQLRDELDEYTPLYNRFKKYFGYMDTGYKGKKHDIFAYNGGLFAADEILDTIKIDDTLLYTHTQKLSRYDFKSEVDVNILGHIFEHSLNEIEEVTAELAGQTIDKSKTKRKKDGVFYTPKYITKYIVENTVGKLCEDKKTELNIDEAEYNKDRKGRNKATLKKLKTQLETYRNWLLGITICDPACGSGAFLNQTLEFLIEEHTYIDELETKLLGGSFVFPNVENAILENNLYGVDINEESIDIAKLSLWLRSAKPNRKLNSLNSNIKCGNSLIDDKEVAGDKAFDWKKEFPKVFKNGGFDVIIGNPPYVVLSPDNFLNYNFTSGNNNTYVAFFEIGLKVLKTNGELGFIVPNTWFSGDNFESFRSYILTGISLSEIIQLPYDIFEAYVDTSIIFLNKEKPSGITNYYKYDIRDFQDNISFSKLKAFPNKEWLKYGKIFLNKDLLKIGKKVWFSKENILLGSISKINRGSLPPKNNEKSSIKTEYYNIRWFDNQIFRYREDVNLECFVNYEALRENKRLEVYKGSRIFGRQLMSRQFRMNLSIVNYDCAFKKNLYAIYDISEKFNAKYILAVLNSKLFSFTQVSFNTSLQRDDFPAFSLRDFKNFSIPKLQLNKQMMFENSVDNMLIKTKDFQIIESKLQTYLKQKFNLQKLSKKLQNWHELEFGDFVKELNKAIKTTNKARLKESLQEVPVLTKKDEFEWLDLFEENKQKAQDLQIQINQTDKEIDQMVYELYGLTEDEIKIVEGA